MKTGYRMTRLLMVGCGMKIFRWEVGFLILAGGMQDSFKIGSKMWDEKGKLQLTDVD